MFMNEFDYLKGSSRVAPNAPSPCTRSLCQGKPFGPLPGFLSVPRDARLPIPRK